MASDTIKLRYLKIGQDLLIDTLVTESMNIEAGKRLKEKILNRLGIIRQDNETYLQAWLRHIAEINNIEHTLPCDDRISDAILNDISANHFMWAIA